VPTYIVTINGKERSVALRNDNTVAIDGTPVPFDAHEIGTGTLSVLMEGASHTVVARKNDDGYQILLAGKQLEAVVESERSRLLRKFDTQGSSGPKKVEIKAPMPALVVKVEVAVGDSVKPGQGLLILEAMKMENEIKAHSSGVVKTIYVTQGKPVEKGELLILLE
jgi:pyruvate carboxylase subunit B